MEATRGAILARGSEGVPLLLKQLVSSDRVMFALGLQTARELPGSKVTKAIANAMQRCPPARKARLLMALADREDPSVLPAVLEAAKSDSGRLKLAAVEVLGRVGNSSCIPVLLEAATQENAKLAEAATKALEELPGENVNENLAARLSEAKGKERRVLIELAGLRGIESATETLMKAADSPNADIRAAALTALGATVGPGELSFLIKRVLEPEKPTDVKPAEKALRTACTRMPDREACAAKLADSLWNMPFSTKSIVRKKRWDVTKREWRWKPVSPRSTIVEVLGAVGGKKALATVAEAAEEANPELRETAIHVLGEWLSTDAAGVLLDLVKTTRGPKHRLLAMRGFVRIVDKFKMPEPRRAEMCRSALKAARRKAEKSLVLDVMKKHPSIDTLKVAVDAAKDPQLKSEAKEVSLAIAQKVGGKSVDVSKLLAQVGHEPMDIEIIKAEYGAGSTFKDVTEILRKHVRDFPLIALPSSSYNSSFGGDPVRGVVKQLKVHYRINGKEGKATFTENAPIVLPMPK